MSGSDPKKIEAPWTSEQVDALNRFQRYEFIHPFTCPQDHQGDRVLFATVSGWRCPHCDYRQYWATEIMLREWTDPRAEMVGRLPPDDLLTPLSGVVTDERYSNEFVGIAVRANWAEIAAGLEHAAAGVHAVTEVEMSKLQAHAHAGAMLFETGTAACLEIESMLANIADRKYRLEKQIRDKRNNGGSDDAASAETKKAD